MPDAWHREDNVYVLGKAFFKDELYEKGGLCSLLKEVEDAKEMKSLLEKFNGFYGIIKECDDKVLVGTDHIGKVPLFYSKGVKTDQIVIGDSFNKVFDNLSSRRWDSLSITELLLGYPSGLNTIHKDISRVQAGEVVSIKKNNDQLKKYRHFVYMRNPEPVHSEKKLLREMDGILTRATERLVEASENPIILGLSGGFDSRLIALLLRKVGCEDVVLYCHNTQNPDDMRISKKVAEDLGYRWFGFNYTKEDVEEACSDNDLNYFFNELGSGGGNLINPTGLVKYSKFKNRASFPDSGTTVSGSHAGAPANFLPDRWFFDRKKISKDFFIKGLLRKHHKGLRYIYESTEIPDFLEERLFNSLIGIKNKEFIEKYILGGERWYWQERTAKRLSRHPLVRRTYGYSGWYPLWDREFAEFFEKVPFYLRYNKRLQKKYTTLLYKKLCGKNRRTNKKRSDKKILPIAKKAANALNMDKIAWKTYDMFKYHKNRLQREAVYDSNLKYSFIPREGFLKRYTGREYYRFFLSMESLNHYLQREELEEIAKKVPTEISKAIKRNAGIQTKALSKS